MRHWKRRLPKLLALLAALLTLVACDSASTAYRPVTVEIWVAAARGLRPAAAELPRVEAKLFSCDVGTDCDPSGGDTTLLAIEGERPAGPCIDEVDGACVMVFTTSHSSRTLWLEDGHYAITA